MGNKPSVALKGKWDRNISWEFYVSETLPEDAPCNVVYCLAVIKHTDQIVLTRIGRGWEMLGGHIEPNETLHDALVRECMEEGGYSPETFELFGYSKITAKKAVANGHHGGTYPLVTYIPHYIAISDIPLVGPTGDEVLESGVFSHAEIAGTGTAHSAIIDIGIQVYKEKRTKLANPAKHAAAIHGESGSE